MHDDLLFKTYSILWSFLNATLYCNFKISVKCTGILNELPGTFGFIFSQLFLNIIKKKKTQKLNMLLCTMKIFLKKKELQIIMFTHFLYFPQNLQHTNPPPPTSTPSKTIYYVCVVHFSQKQSILHVYVCFAFQSQEQSSPALTQCVRKDLAMAVRDLMQHGLMEVRFISTPHTPPTHTHVYHMHVYHCVINTNTNNGGQICNMVLIPPF